MGTLIARLDGEGGHKDSVYSVAFGPDGETLVSGSLDKTIKMWQLLPENRGMMGGNPVPRGGKLVKTFEGHKVSNLRLHIVRHSSHYPRISSLALR